MADERFNQLRAGYDRVAAEYANHIADELAHKPFDRELLSRFARLADGPILDAGCGPGHVARFLADRGASVRGLDLSPEMVAQARALNPEIPFATGSMTELSEIGAFGGIVAFYSIIHVSRHQQIAMFATWRRALRLGGYALVSFHIGEEDRHLDELFGQPVSLDFLFFTGDEVIARLTAAGFALVERHERDPYPEVEVATRRGYLLAQALPSPIPNPRSPRIAHILTMNCGFASMPPNNRMHSSRGAEGPARCRPSNRPPGAGAKFGGR
jgi:SAM-dependent methyltransferase